MNCSVSIIIMDAKDQVRIEKKKKKKPFLAISVASIVDVLAWSFLIVFFCMLDIVVYLLADQNFAWSRVDVLPASPVVSETRVHFLK